MAGTFAIGDFQVTLTRDFLISKYELTFDEYDEYCQATGSTKPDDNGWGRGKRPVINVSWYNAADYCNWRSKKERLMPCYSGAGNSIRCDFSASGYRLPTEAEWEYAARGGNRTKGYKCSGSNNANEVAVTNSNRTEQVGSKKSNELGLYDMSGNVEEWCWDWYNRNPQNINIQTDPVGPQMGADRILRGGSWSSYRVELGVGLYAAPDAWGRSMGFRLVRR
jgi:formylglycine-generating enzyme required for sulfatase activity